MNTSSHTTSAAPESITPCCAIDQVSDRLRHVLDVHFHPDWGSPFWLRKQEQLGWDVRDRICSLDDLPMLGLIRPEGGIDSASSRSKTLQRKHPSSKR